MSSMQRYLAVAACLLLCQLGHATAARQARALKSTKASDFEVDVGIYDPELPTYLVGAGPVPAPAATPAVTTPVLTPSAVNQTANATTPDQTPTLYGVQTVGTEQAGSEKEVDPVPSKVPEQLFATEQQALGIVSSPSPTSAAAPVGPVKPCEVIQALQVCSHRANASEVAEVSGQRVGLLQRLAILESHGLVCHDLDVFQTQDGALRVGHPAELKAFRFGSHLMVIDSQEAASGASGSLAGPGAAPAANHSRLDVYFPLLDDLLVAFNGLTGTTHDGDAAGSRGTPQLFLELKGRALQEHNLKHLAEKAKALELDEAIAVWVAHARGQAIVEAVRAGGVRLDAIKSFPDRLYAAGMKLSHGGGSQEGHEDAAAKSRSLQQADDQHSIIMHHLQPHDTEMYQYLGPSIRAKPVELFATIRATTRPLVLWTVDTPGQLAAAIQHGASRIISNQPVAMKKLADEWSKTCQATGTITLPAPAPEDLL